MNGRYSKAGQALAEYAVMTGIVLAMVMVMALLLYVFKEHGGRLLNLVASEYP